MLTHFKSLLVTSGKQLLAAPFSAKVRIKLTNLCGGETSDPKGNTLSEGMNTKDLSSSCPQRSCHGSHGPRLF